MSAESKTTLSEPIFYVLASSAELEFAIGISMASRFQKIIKKFVFRRTGNFFSQQGIQSGYQDRVLVNSS
jgi:hypothetical protein